MKRFTVAGVAAMAALALFSCKKDQTTGLQAARPQGATAVAASTRSDELDAILKDLSPDTYLLTFQGLPANNYITKTTYGSLSDEEFCGNGRYPFPIPSLEKLGYKKVPFPKIWIKTCPTMIPVLDIAKRAALLMQKADAKTFADITIVQMADKLQVLATKTFLAAAGRIQPDAVDKAIGSNSLEKFRLSIPQGTRYPLFTRGFYGQGDITLVPGAGAKTTIYTSLKWEDILRRKFPNMIGCFNPEILKDIRANLARLNTGFEKLNVEEVADGAILGFN